VTSLWSQGSISGNASSSPQQQALGLVFEVSQAASLNKIWFYSPSGAPGLPAAVGVYVQATQATVTTNSSPSWSGAAGSGWVSTTLTATLSASTLYTAVVYHGTSFSGTWDDYETGYWTTGGAGASGISNGIVSAPNSAGGNTGVLLNGGGSISYPTSSFSNANYWIDVDVSPAGVSGAANLTGSGSLTASGHVTQPAAAALSGAGTLTAAGTASTQVSATLIGLGALTAGATVTGTGQGTASLSGSGTLGVTRTVTWQQAAALSGTGTLSLLETGTVEQAAALSGSGTLSVAAAAALKFTAGLFGAGFLSIPQVAGGLVNGVGGASTPQALPGSSQVAVAPPGSSNWQWLGTLGQVTALTYSYVCPGGCDKMSMTVMCPASFRTQLFNPGWNVKITRGGHQVWDGKLDEPQPTAQGWNLTAVGTGNLGANYVSFYSPLDVWPVSEPDEIINRAISRGLPWVNAGLNSSPYFSQFWLGQATDPGSSTVTAFLNLICTRGGLVWYVNSQPGGIYAGDDLNVFPLPTVPNRLLVCTSPVARTLGGYTNAILIRYMQTADNTTTNTAATFAVVSAINYQSQAAHGVLEAYLDLSNASVLTAAQALAVGYAILQTYEAASYAGPFTASYGQLLNMGGQAIDPGVDQAGTRMKIILVDGGYGGEVVPGPIEFTVGSYSWDDFQQVATITPYQDIDASLSGLLSMASTTMTPITVAGG
jgi:hypothetical protein